MVIYCCSDNIYILQTNSVVHISNSVLLDISVTQKIIKRQNKKIRIDKWYYCCGRENKEKQIDEINLIESSSLMSI